MTVSINEKAFQIILYGGNGRSSAMEAIQCAKERNFKEAEMLISEAEKEINKAHKFQTELLQDEANGESSELNLLLIQIGRASCRERVELTECDERLEEKDE